MDGVYPFSTSPEESREIRQVGSILFAQGNPLNFEETREWAIKWNPFFQLFLQSVDRRTGSLLHLPFDGGLFEQGAKTMTILMIMQEVYMKSLDDSMKALKSRRK